MRSSLIACLLFLPTLLDAEVKVTENVSLPEHLEVSDQQLVLNGYGIREKWWINLYAVALYLPKKTSDVSYIKGNDVPKAIRVEVFHSTPAKNVPDKWRNELVPILSQKDMNTLRSAYVDLKAGDNILITCTLDQRTNIYLNDRLLLQHNGTDLMNAFLNIWIGAQPVSENLRRSLLHKPS